MTSLKFCSSIYKATGVTSPRGWPRSNFVLVFMGDWGDETEGCPVEGLTCIAIAVSNVAIRGILLAMAQDVFLSYCVVNSPAP